MPAIRALMREKSLAERGYYAPNWPIEPGSLNALRMLKVSNRGQGRGKLRKKAYKMGTYPKDRSR